MADPKPGFNPEQEEAPKQEEAKLPEYKEEETIAQLRGLLAVPSRFNFKKLTELFAKTHDTNASKVQLDTLTSYTESHLASWDPKLRDIPSYEVNMIISGRESEIPPHALQFVENGNFNNLSYPRDQIPRIANSRLVNTIRILELRESEIGYSEIAELSKASFESVKELDLGRNPIDDDVLKALIKAPFFSNITTLKLNNNQRLGHLTKGGFSALINAPESKNIVDLNLHYTGATAKNLAAFSENPAIRKLEKLDVSANGIINVDWLAGSPIIESLSDINLSSNSLWASQESLEKLFNNPSFKPEKLRLRRCKLNSEVFSSLTNSGALSKTETLDLTWNPLGAKGLEMLANCEDLKSLKRLDMEVITNETGSGKDEYEGIPEAIANLLNSIYLENIEHLNIGVNKIDAKTLQKIVDSKYLQKLKSLSLEGNEIGDEGMKVLASSEITQLEFLNISACGLSNKGMSTLANSPNFRNLRELHLLGGGIEGLAKSPYITKLEKIDIIDHQESEELFEWLTSDNLKNLRTLKITSRVSMEYANKLAQSAFKDTIQEIEISDTSSNVVPFLHKTFPYCEIVIHYESIEEEDDNPHDE